MITRILSFGLVDLVYRRSFSTEGELRNAVFEYIEAWYNKKRKRSSLGHVSPKQFKASDQSAL
ncbi:MAG: IS3 family transposase [Oligoflexales bacterium]